MCALSAKEIEYLEDHFIEIILFSNMRFIVMFVTAVCELFLITIIVIVIIIISIIIITIIIIIIIIIIITIIIIIFFFILS